MPCTNPKKCWQYGTTKNGKPNYVFKRPTNVSGLETQKVPCGKCLSCLIDKSKEHATRGFHESQMHTYNCFITLTYNDDNLPEYGSLSKAHFKAFIKALKYQFRGMDWKYIGAGEYGSPENTFRPHYHLCLFGIDFPDKEYLFTNEHGDAVYKSELLLKCWKGKGHVSIGELNYRTVAYVARYTTKKIVERGKHIQEHFWIDKKTGETNYDPEAYKNGLLMQNKLPEFLSMSPGIGKTWWEKYKQDTYKDYVTCNFMKAKIPRYYDKKLEEHNEELMKEIKEKRKQKAKELDQKLDKPSDAQRAKVKKKQLSQIKRKL
jgi:hypothetical protein